MINYQLLADSIKYYEQVGYKRIEAPWTVTKEIQGITKPEGASFWTIEEKNKVLVASGEQSFLYLYNKGFLPYGKFQTITPCFRDDPFGKLHTKYFIKNELINTYTGVHTTSYQLMMTDAKQFFENIIKDTVDIIQTSEYSADLVYKGDELGSYGYRECEFLNWTYGTGLAEPRLTSILIKHGISPKNYT